MKVAAIYLSERAFPRYFDPNGLLLSKGDICIVEDSQIQEAPGLVGLLETRTESQLSLGPKLPRVLRSANESEIERWRNLKAREMEAMGLVKEASRRLKLDMKITTVRFDDRQRRVIFNFTAEQRVDFRQLVRELASALKSRIELWQIGVRDESKTVNGYGVCGQNLCCSSWIKEFKPVSIRQAKDQDLMLSPTKLSGQCGRLLCCLTYEHEHYRESSRGIPNVGAICRTAGGEEVIVLDRNLLTHKLVVRDPQGHSKIIESSEIAETIGKAPPSALRQDPSARLASMAQGGERPGRGGRSSRQENEDATAALEAEQQAPPKRYREEERKASRPPAQPVSQKNGLPAQAGDSSESGADQQRRQHSHKHRPSHPKGPHKPSQHPQQKKDNAAGSAPAKPAPAQQDQAKAAEGGKKHHRRFRPRKQNKPSET